MDTVELVIKIPREDYALIMSGRFYLCNSRGNGKTLTGNLVGALCGGTLLPSGHGRLIDADKFISEHFGEVARLVDAAQTIIEADEEGAEEGSEVFG